MKRLSCTLIVFSVSLLSVLTVQAQPANDLFANAWPLVGAVATTNGTTAGASKEPGEPNHANNAGGRSVWFTWTAPSGGQIRVDTIGSSHNTLLAVYTGSAVNNLTLIAANNNGDGLQGGVSRLEFLAAPGITYRIVVDSNRGFQTPQGGAYVLNVRTLASIAITSPTNQSVFTTGELVPLTVGGEVPTPP